MVKLASSPPCYGASLERFCSERQASLRFSPGGHFRALPKRTGKIGGKIWDIDEHGGDICGDGGFMGFPGSRGYQRWFKGMNIGGV